MQWPHSSWGPQQEVQAHGPLSAAVRPGVSVPVTRGPAWGWKPVWRQISHTGLWHHTSTHGPFPETVWVFSQRGGWLLTTWAMGAENKESGTTRAWVCTGSHMPAPPPPCYLQGTRHLQKGTVSKSFRNIMRQETTLAVILASLAFTGLCLSFSALPLLLGLRISLSLSILQSSKHVDSLQTFLYACLWMGHFISCNQPSHTPWAFCVVFCLLLQAQVNSVHDFTQASHLLKLRQTWGHWQDTGLTALFPVQQVPLGGGGTGGDHGALNVPDGLFNRQKGISQTVCGAGRPTAAGPFSLVTNLADLSLQ